MAPRKREGKKDKKRFNLFVSQFVDCQGLTSLESFLLQYQPTKIICSDKLTNIKKLNNICETLSADLQQEKSSLFTSKDIDQDLPRVLGESSISRFIKFINNFLFNFFNHPFSYIFFKRVII